MTKIAAAAAACMIVLTGAYSGAASTPQGAIFTAVVQSVKARSDMVITLKTLRDRHGHKVGTGSTVCIFLGNGSSQCVGTFSLPKGKIAVAGTRTSRDFFVFAITGGTGAYNGWSGTLVGRTWAMNPLREKLVFQGIAP